MGKLRNTRKAGKGEEMRTGRKDGRDREGVVEVQCEE
jgi:hypothetical protein